MNARIPSGPCLCGATDCPSCGPAQGYRLGADDECGGVPDLICHVRGLIDDAELAHELGNDEKARNCLREALILLQDDLGE